MTEKGSHGSRRALGRGLDALVPVAEPAGLREVEVAAIEPNPNQPRQRFDRPALEDLAASIHQHGVVQPLVVSQLGNDRYRLIVGERRWQAAKLAGLRQVPVVVKDASDRQTLELALIENLQRADLNALEEAAAYQRLIQDFGLTQQQVADQVGRSRVAVANTLRLLSLPQTLKTAVIENRTTEGHARALLALPDPHLQLAALERVERDGLTVRQTEELVRRLLEGRPRKSTGKTKSPDTQAAEDQLRRALGSKVSLQPGKGGGKIIIEWGSDEEFQSLFELLVGGI
jgi:ParB family chromosome partitioning protein